MDHWLTKYTRIACGLLIAIMVGLSLAGGAVAYSATATPKPDITPSTVTPTSGPSPTPTLIITIKTTLLFPMAIRFTDLLNCLPDQLKSVRLHISQRLLYDQSFDLPVTKDTTKSAFGNYTMFQYAWTLTGQSEPLLFNPMDYELTFTTNNGNSGTFQGQLDYLDNTQKWKNTVGDTISLYTHNSGLAIDRLQNGALRAYALINQDTSIKHSFKMVIYEAGITPCTKDPARHNQPVVYDPADGAEFPCDPTAATKLYNAQGFVEVLRSSPQIDVLQDQISEIIAADAYDTLWKAAAEPPPLWFRAGISARYDVVGHTFALLTARDADRTNQLLSLSELAVPAVVMANDHGASVRAWNAQSYLLTLYLAAQFGADAPVKIAQQIGQKGKFADALAAVGNGAKIEDLYASWKDWLFSPAADEAVAWSPYLTDATATHTPSPTDFPTLTPTDSGPTATDTPLFSKTSTPRPSRTPPPTDTPNLPTNTPLPPGSLNTATPISTGVIATSSH